MARKKKKVESTKRAVPAYMTSFADMMTLMLTFFILLVAFAEEPVVEDASVFAEPVAEVIPAFAELVAEPAPVVEEPVAVVEETESVVEETESVVAAATMADVEAKVSALGDDDIEKIIEKVVTRVVEKLAGSILEKVAWEVVPDLAENLIREEIRKGIVETTDWDVLSS